MKNKKRIGVLGIAAAVFLAGEGFLETNSFAGQMGGFDVEVGDGSYTWNEQQWGSDYSQQWNNEYWEYQQWNNEYWEYQQWDNTGENIQQNWNDSEQNVQQNWNHAGENMQQDWNNIHGNIGQNWNHTEGNTGQSWNNPTGNSQYNWGNMPEPTPVPTQTPQPTASPTPEPTPTPVPTPTPIPTTPTPAATPKLSQPHTDSQKVQRLPDASVSFSHEEKVRDRDFPSITLYSEGSVQILSFRINKKESSWHWQENMIIADIPIEKGEYLIELFVLSQGGKTVYMDPWEFSA